MLLVPEKMAGGEVLVHVGDREYRQRLNPGRANVLTVPFVPGPVSFEVADSGKVVLAGQGREISDDIETYNFNMWTGSWSADV